ncbi:MAG: hypothetical protein M3Q48_09220 [Actinomycetota bacterium]|nr:hypothetical protein [Actinomycetota bacterium]
MARRPAKQANDRAAAARRAGVAAVASHPLFVPLLAGASLVDTKDRSACPDDGWATVTTNGTVHLHPTRVGSAAEWSWVVAHALLHLAFGHVDPGPRSGRIDRPYNVASCLAVNRFLGTLKVGRAPESIEAHPILPTWIGGRLLSAGEEHLLAAELRNREVPATLTRIGTAPTGDLAPGPPRATHGDWDHRFAEGLEAAVTAAVAVAAGEMESLIGQRPRRRTPWSSALSWFVSSFPLLGALASGMRLVEDADVCRRLDIGVAAVAPLAGELYLNPAVVLSAGERRFVVGHELLHAGLRHDTRSGGRDPWLWNVACDFVINAWLVEMGVGELPDGALYDAELEGRSAEEVYDRIATDLRRARKLRTFRGVCSPDMLPGRLPGTAEASAAVDLDEFCRRALVHGLDLHRRAGRGLVPAGLVEAIDALDHPPIAWDVALARWFDDHFPALERRRTYVRLSRRQSATPDIPRPALHLPAELVSRRTFGVVLDTSGSMDRLLLAKALGAIASYAATRDVPAARVVFCDAAAYDAGYLSPEEIAGRVRVRGRGGTILQPGIDLLEGSRDFPDDGPILLITDGGCDAARVRRDHAWLIPHGARLPVIPRGPVFRVS